MFSKERRESLSMLMERVSGKPERTWRNNGVLKFQTLLQLLHFARCIYVVIAVLVVCHGFHQAFIKFKNEDVSTRQEYQALDKIRYPSVTFCYKYKHGSKRVFDNFLPKFYEVAKNKECFMDFTERRGGNLGHFTGIANASFCNKECQKFPKCSVWTYLDGRCYMKNEKTFLIKTNDLVSGKTKNCYGEECIMKGYDLYGGDIGAQTANSYTECHKKCLEDENCKRWTFVPSKNQDCFLKKEHGDEISFCHDCKTGFRNSKNIKCGIKGAYENLFLDFPDMIPERTSFLTTFTQRFETGAEDIDVLRMNEYWKKFIPNENSGPCYTYTPPEDSDPGDTNNMYMTFNFTQWDEAIEIFLHDNKTFFYSERDTINSKHISSDMLNQTGIKHPRALVKISTQRKKVTDKALCNDDPDYNFFQCTEDYYASKRGCQYPWNVNNNSDIKICRTYDELSSVQWQFSQNIDTGAGREMFKLSEILLKKRKECPPPCFLKKYSLQFEEWARFSTADKVSLQISLDGFLINHEEEYFNCDNTCIIGELGGNLGFFLGGSILLGLDLLFRGVRKVTGIN